MTEKEVFEEITSELKWYIPHFSQQYASALIKRYKQGTLKPQTVNRIFHLYGYTKTSFIQWERKNGSK